MQKKFEINQTKIKGGCELWRKVVTHNSNFQTFLLSITASPQNVEDCKSGAGKSSIVRLSSIKEIMNQGKHALLDVTPNAVDKLNYAQLYPIVIYARAETKQTIKDCRAGLPK